MQIEQSIYLHNSRPKMENFMGLQADNRSYDTSADKPLAFAPAVPGGWAVVVLAGAVLMITMGIRQTVGLFVHPITQNTGMDIVEVSFAIAVGQLLWGVFQPIFGAYADKKGAFGVLAAGALCIAAGQIATVWVSGPWGLILTLGVLSPAGAAAGSFSVLFGVAAARLAPEKRSFASGVINAGGSIGQFAFAPMVQFFMSAWGYASALISLGVWGLISIPFGWMLCKTGRGKAGSLDVTAAAASVSVAPAMAREGLKDQLRVAARDRSYLLLHAGFFTCGFHVAFLTTHLPGEVALCGHSASVSAASLSLIGLCNIAGSIGAGILGKHFRMKYILAFLYASRAAMIAAYLMAPKTELTFYIFAAGTGFTWLATVPPTAGIVGKLFGLRYLATLFGMTLLTHQIGGFLGAWLGGIAMRQSGNFLWVWYVDVALALLAAAVNLPIKEESPKAFG